MQTIMFPNGAGQKLTGILSAPGQGEKKRCVVMCHGLGSSKESTTCKMLTQSLNDAGIATFRFDFHGHGDSEGKFEDVLVSQAVHDVLHAIVLMKEKGYEDVALFGSSFGGYAAYQAAAKTPHLSALALKCPVADFSSLEHEKMVDVDLETWKTQGHANWHGRKLNWGYAEDCRTANAFGAMGHIDCPALIVHGSSDDVVPLQQSRRASELIPTCTLLVIQEADHAFSQEEHFNEMLIAISEFLENAF